MGYKRNLDASEIVDQVLAVERWHLAKWRLSSAKPQGGLVNNIVMMGMGEPLANYDNLIRALEIFNSSWGLNIGARKITVSTSGPRAADSPPRRNAAAISPRDLVGTARPTRCATKSCRSTASIRSRN